MTPVRSRNGYCGPSAMAPTLGITADEAAAAPRPFRYDDERSELAAGHPPPPVTGVRICEFVFAIRSFGAASR